MTDESNGESTFEFVETRPEESFASAEIAKTDSFSSLSSAASLLTPLGISTSSANLISNVPPPSALPSFVSNPGLLTCEINSQKLDPTLEKEHIPIREQPALATVKETKELLQKESQQLIKNEPSVSSALNVQIVEATEPEMQDIGIISGGLFSWVKETVVNSNVLSKVAEKAKNSVNTMITTLDPQMREFIYMLVSVQEYVEALLQLCIADSGGDIEIIVASDKDVKISPVRQAFQTVFGKATVTGVSVNSTAVAVQPIGFAAGVKGAEERINSARKNPSVLKDIPIVAIENFLLEVGEDKWYDVGVVLLNDPKNNVNLQTFTQMTPVPSQIVALAQQSTPEDYPLKWSGLAVTIGSLMADNLQVAHNEWHNALTGISRRDIILLAVQSLVGIYKNTIVPV